MWKTVACAALALTFAQRPATVQIRSGAAPVCDAVRRALARDRRAFAESLGQPPFDAIAWKKSDDDAAISDLEYADEARFDFDNDGSLDRVLRRYYETHYMQGSVALVLLGPKMTDRWFLPCQLDAKPIAFADCPPFSQKNDEAGFSMHGRTPREKPFFRGRYLDLTPFRFASATYVAVESRSDDTSSYVAVIQPVAGKKFEPACLLSLGR